MDGGKETERWRPGWGDEEGGAGGELGGHAGGRGEVLLGAAVPAVVLGLAHDVARNGAAAGGGELEGRGGEEKRGGGGGGGGAESLNRSNSKGETVIGTFHSAIRFPPKTTQKEIRG